jgi:hypothetical protein
MIKSLVSSQILEIERQDREGVVYQGYFFKGTEA